MDSIAHFLLNIFFPASCVACRRDRSSGSVPVCLSCLSQIIPANESTAGSEDVTAVSSAVLFDTPFREILHAFKYQGKDYLAPLLIDIWMRHWEPPPVKVDCLMPVPMSFWKEIKRGYNQSEILAKELGKRLSLPVESKYLWRKGGRPSQTKLTRQERQKNALASFGIRKKAASRLPKVVLLVDDVYTTGATMKTCAGLLKKSGVKTVFGATLAFEERQVNNLDENGQ